MAASGPASSAGGVPASCESAPLELPELPDEPLPEVLLPLESALPEKEVELPLISVRPPPPLEPTPLPAELPGDPAPGWAMDPLLAEQARSALAQTAVSAAHARPGLLRRCPSNGERGATFAFEN
jgi:hypothetical protein